MEIKGKIAKKLPLQSGTSKAGKEWSKQEWVIQTDGQFPRNVCVSQMNDRISTDIAEGDMVTAHIDINAREFNGRWYNEVSAWKIEKLQIFVQEPVQPVAQVPPTPEQQQGIFEGQTDGLPF